MSCFGAVQFSSLHKCVHENKVTNHTPFPLSPLRPHWRGLTRLWRRKRGELWISFIPYFPAMWPRNCGRVSRCRLVNLTTSLCCSQTSSVSLPSVPSAHLCRSFPCWTSFTRALTTSVASWMFIRSVCRLRSVWHSNCFLFVEEKLADYLDFCLLATLFTAVLWKK